MIENAWPSPIPLSERLPDEGAIVLWYLCDQGIWESGYYDPQNKRYKPGRNGEGAHLTTMRITHWMPMPPKPE